LKSCETPELTMPSPVAHLYSWICDLSKRSKNSVGHRTPLNEMCEPASEVTTAAANRSSLHGVGPIRGRRLKCWELFAAISINLSSSELG
jgi:hypothetical protein